MIQKPCIEVKIVFLGGSGVGKSSIIARQMTDSFSVKPVTTLGAAFAHYMINIQGNDMKFQIWDTAGQERYKALLPLYYRDTQVAVVVYDTTSIESFQQLKYWSSQLNDNGPAGLITILVGNKTDLIVDDCVPRDQANEYAAGLGLDLLFCSCKTGEGVKVFYKTYNSQQDLFDHIGQRVWGNIQISEKQPKRRELCIGSKQNFSILSESKEESNSSCC